jgi:hypothetical protein
MAGTDDRRELDVAIVGAWGAGHNSDEMIDLAAQPDPSLPIHICGEVFSRVVPGLRAHSSPPIRLQPGSRAPRDE